MTVNLPSSLEDGCDEITKLAGDDDACGEDRDSPCDGEVAWTFFGCEDFRVDEAKEEVLLWCFWTSSSAGREEAFLRRAMCGCGKSRGVSYSEAVENASAYLQIGALTCHCVCLRVDDVCSKADFVLFLFWSEIVIGTRSGLLPV